MLVIFMFISLYILIHNHQAVLYYCVITTILGSMSKYCRIQLNFRLPTRKILFKIILANIFMVMRQCLLRRRWLGLGHLNCRYILHTT